MSMVHIVTLVTGEFEDTSRQVVGAYLDEGKALARKRELEEIIELCALDYQSTRERVSTGGDYALEGSEEELQKLAGLDYVYISYNGLGVFMESIPLIG